MSILFVSNSGESLPIALRLKQEGTKATVYLHDLRYRRNCKGMVPTVGIGSLKDTLKKADLVVFDISRNNEHTKNDHALLKTPLTDFFMNDFKGEFYDGFAASAQISIPPTKRVGEPGFDPVGLLTSHGI